MIEAEHQLTIDTGIHQVWDYVQDISKWAVLFPGCRECEIIDEHNSKWVIKVGAGGMVKTVNVLVHVEQWDGPEGVDFSFELASEPVVGSGTYRASALGSQETAVNLTLRVEGSGQMAPMWEAMSKPLLPQMAKSFSNKLKTEIETAAGLAVETKPSLLARLRHWLQRLFGGKTHHTP